MNDEIDGFFIGHLPDPFDGIGKYRFWVKEWHPIRDPYAYYNEEFKIWLYSILGVQGREASRLSRLNQTHDQWICLNPDEELLKKLGYEPVNEKKYKESRAITKRKEAKLWMINKKLQMKEEHYNSTESKHRSSTERS